jgi:ABC-type transporter Mla subunit MlaD
MPKFTRCIKKNKKNRTLKSESIFAKNGGANISDEERKGIIDILGDKISDVTSSVTNKAEDIGLNALGLEKINKPDEESKMTEKLDENLDKISDAASGVISDVGNVVNKASASVIDNINDVLSSPTVSESVKEAGEETAAITGKLAETFNDALDDPVVKAEVEQAIENAGQIGTVVAKAAEEPLKEVARVSVSAGTDALSAASSGAVKVATDILASIPGIGAIFDIGKILNDGSKAASAMVEAGSEAIETASDAFIETKANVEKGLKELEEKKKMAEQISNRTTKSINQFENPLSKTTQSGGSKKTKRRLFKRKAKSKRVRFAI